MGLIEIVSKYDNYRYVLQALGHFHISLLV